MKKRFIYYKISKKLLTLLSILVVFIVVLLCYKQQFQQTPLKFYIFQTSDTHGQLEADNKYRGGWLKLGSEMKKEIDIAGGYDNCLLIDCGDTFQGTVDALESKGKFAISIMNDLKYDVFVPGNHDFDFGIDSFINRISSLKADVIAANLIVTGQTKKEIMSWKIYTRNNIKIAIIGMTSPYLKYWLWGKGHERYKVTPISEALAKVMPEVLKADPDFTVLAIHHGLYNSKRFPGNDNFLRTVIKKYPQINIVFGGHTHQIYPGESLYNNSVYIQAGAHAEYISKVEVVVDRYGENSPLITAELIPIQHTAQLGVQQGVSVGETIKRSNIKRNIIVGKTNQTIDGKGTPGIDNKMGRFFANAVLQAVKADAAMCTVIKPGYKLSGNITYNDIFNICPYEDTIVALSLNHSQLIKIITEQNTYKDKYRKNLGLYGVEFEGNKNIHIHLFNDKDRVNVAFSSYDIAGAGNRYPVLKKIAQKREVQAFDTKILLRDAVIKFIRSKDMGNK